MRSKPAIAIDGNERERVVSQAIGLAAERLGLSDLSLAQTIGISEADVSALRGGRHHLQKGSDPYELAVLLLRLFRSLSSILHEDESMQSWMQSPNLALVNRPIEMIGSRAGLMSVIDYLDSRRRAE